MFNRERKKDKEKLAKFKDRCLYSFCQLFGCFAVLFKPRSWKKFVKGERKEIRQLRQGREDRAKFCHDSLGLIKDIFIPHEGNSYKPKALRLNSLVGYATAAILVKLLVTGFLFFVYPSPAQLTAIVSNKMITLANEARQKAGIEPLEINNTLTKAALAKGQDMIHRQYFSHNTPENKKPWEWIDRNEFDYIYAGENLAMDFTSAELVQEAFMKSPAHRKNIINPNYKELGVAVINGGMNDHQTILLVEFFATQRKDALTLALAPIDNHTYVESPELSETVKSAEVENLAGNDSPTSSLAESLSPPVEGIIVVATEKKDSRALVDLVIEYSNIFFMTVIIFILISLSLNVFIKIKVQDYPLILQVVVVVAIITAVWLVKFHFVEQITPQTLIL